MAESFSDLWAASGPVKSQQLPLKSLVATANTNGPNSNGPNGTRRSTPDTFSMFASAGSSQPNSRPITPLAVKGPLPSKAAPSNAADAFGGLVSFGGSTSRVDGLTIAERAAKVERERREQGQRQQAALESQDSFWDQFEASPKPQVNSAPPPNKANDDLLYDFLTPDLDFLPLAPPVTVPLTGGDGVEDDEDDILGSLAKPIEEVRHASPRLSSRTVSPSRPTKSGTPPPPHIVGRIVEMGFSVEQAKVALAATPSGIDVDAALEILLQNTGADTDEHGPERDRDREAEAEQKRLGHQVPSRAVVSSSDTSANVSPSPGHQSGLQDQADKLLAHASTIGLNMLNKANSFWKEGREKVVKVYGEQRAGGDAGRSAGRPRWMAESHTITNADEAFMGMNARSTEAQPVAPRSRPVALEKQHQDQVSLFADEELVYKSPARRRPPAAASISTSVSTSQPRGASRSPAPVRISRAIIHASQSALLASNTHKTIGNEHFDLGRFAESETAYSNAITALPAAHLLRVPLHNNRALARFRTGDYQGAVDDCSEAVRIITGKTGTAWHPSREVQVEDAGVDLGDALGKALRRRAEAREGMEKWREAMVDWEWLNAASWVSHTLRTDAVAGAGRCRRMLTGTTGSGSGLRTQTQKPRPKPVQLSALTDSGPSEAVSRVRDANAAQEAEDQARHDLKDVVDARLTAWRAGKETNIRALIASLDTVLWPELGWQKVGMAELVSPRQVKIRYTKAISKLHPDKLSVRNTGLEHRMIANGVFGTLNEAWNAFS